MGLSEARRCDIWYNAHTKSKGEFVVKGNAKVTALAFECDLDTKAVECSYLPNGPDSLFN